jgi:hypothetical protein
MSPNLAAPGGHVIENPLSGERITIGAPRADGSVLDWKLVLALGGRVPSSHVHPRQEQCFTVLAGRRRRPPAGLAGPAVRLRRALPRAA